MTKKSKIATAEAEAIAEATAEAEAIAEAMAEVMAEAEAKAKAKAVASVKFKDINIVVGGLESEQGACAALDCNDKNIGKARTAATSGADDALTVVSKGFAEGLVGLVPINAFITDASTVNAPPDYRNYGNTMFNSLGLLDACVNYPTETHLPSPTISAFSPTQTHLAMSAEDLGFFKAGDVVFIGGDATLPAWIRGRMLVVDSVEPTGLVVPLVFVSTASSPLLVLNTIPGSIFRDVQSNAVSAFKPVGASVFTYGYLGQVEPYDGAISVPGNVQYTDIETSVTVTQNLSRFIKLSGGAYNGIYPINSYPNANTIRVEVPFVASDTGTYEFILFTPVINVINSGSSTVSANFGVTLNALAESADAYVTLALCKANGVGVYEEVLGSTKRYLVKVNTQTPLQISVLTSAINGDSYLIAIKVGVSSPDLKLENFTLWIKD
jgi:hypothetical protein